MKLLLQKAFSVLFIFLLGALGLSYAAPILSKKASVNLLTIYPGEDLFSAWGHSTLWVYDPLHHFDRVYSYGTYDFEQPNFYLNFVKGHLNYQLSTCTMEEQYLSAEYEQRKIVKQELDLDSAQKQKLLDFLEWNLLPQNRNYLYDFYLDNCSSRLRDIFQNCLGSSLRFDKSLQSPLSFRDWMNLYLTPHPWSALGMNIGLGAPADRPTDYFTQMYLPFNLKSALAKATLNSHPLVKSELDILPIPSKETSGSTTPILLVCCSILLVSILLLFVPRPDSLGAVAFDCVLFAFPLLLGIVLTLLWAATDHWVCAWNSDLLWANPLCLNYFFFFSKYRPRKRVLVLLFALCSLLHCVYFSNSLPEKSIFILFPLILAIQVRISYRFFAPKKTHSNA